MRRALRGIKCFKKLPNLFQLFKLLFNCNNIVVLAVFYYYFINFRNCFIQITFIQQFLNVRNNNIIFFYRFKAMKKYWLEIVTLPLALF